MAVLSPLNLILTKFNINDNLEINLSGLSAELKQISNIFSNIKKEDKYIILLDGVSKTTSNIENLVISYSAIEYLMMYNYNNFLIFATNEPELLKIKNHYKNVECLIFQDDIENLIVKKNYKLNQLKSMKNYVSSSNLGFINLLKDVGFPTNFVCEIIEVKERLEKIKDIKKNDEEIIEENYLIMFKNLLKIFFEIKCSDENEDEKFKKIKELKNDYFK